MFNQVKDHNFVVISLIFIHLTKGYEMAKTTMSKTERWNSKISMTLQYENFVWEKIIRSMI